jgi:hypothetical protein
LWPDGRPDAAWDEALKNLEDYNIYQSSAWARHKAGQGWKVRRASAGGRAMVQVLYKKFPGGSVLWSRGGPVGDSAFWNADMRKVLTQGLGLCYFRMCSYRESTEADAKTLKGNGWRRPKHPFNRALTFVYDLAKDEPVLKTELTEYWRHNLKRGQARCQPPVRWENPKAEDLIKVYRDMEAWKGIKQHFVEQELTSLLSAFGERFVLMRVNAIDGQPAALRACVVEGGKAWDLLAAASKEARKNYASYALFWSLALHCRELGVTSYDFGGADPEKAKGVYDFKRGTRARPVEFLGEWDWAPLDLARRAAGLGLKLKGVGDN